MPVYPLISRNLPILPCSIFWPIRSCHCIMSNTGSGINHQLLFWYTRYDWCMLKLCMFRIVGHLPPGVAGSNVGSKCFHERQQALAHAESPPNSRSPGHTRAAPDKFIPICTPVRLYTSMLISSEICLRIYIHTLDQFLDSNTKYSRVKGISLQFQNGQY